jgi:hypothetical protein
MAKLAACIIGTALLTGCSGIARTTFDSAEYSTYVKLGVQADQAKASCGTPEASNSAKLIAATADYTYVYSATKGEPNSRITSASQIVKTLSEQFLNRYKDGAPSPAYCTAKLTEISNAALIIAKSLSKKEE